MTAALLYVPIGVAGTLWILSDGAVPFGIAVVALLLRGSYPIVSAVLHRWRSARREHA